METVQTTALLISARILRRVQETCCHSDSSGKPSANIGVKNSQRSKIMTDETINHIISECSKVAQKEYKTRHDWVGKVIYRELCKKLKRDHTNKWCMHNPAPVLENDTHKLYKTVTYRQITKSRPEDQTL